MGAPSEAALAAFLAAHRDEPLGYADTDCTARGQAPPGFVLDRQRTALGHGVACARAARDAIRRWQMFALPWVRQWPADAPIRVGTPVAVAVRACGLWWKNACRIVSVVDTPERLGFAYGTLRTHAESGEERFVVEALPDGRVWFEIVAISRPAHPLARLGRPLVRRLQQRFRQESAAAMLRAVAGAGP
jgi:uncharacterized protein (UPF0548 family)